jgi:hypothetical protein
MVENKIEVPLIYAENSAMSKVPSPQVLGLGGERSPSAG